MRKKEQARKGLQLRAEDLKSLSEQRADLVQQMKELTGKAEVEKRAFTEEEDKQFDELDKQVKALGSTIGKLERARAMKLAAAREMPGTEAGMKGKKSGRSWRSGRLKRISAASAASSQRSGRTARKVPALRFLPGWIWGTMGQLFRLRLPTGSLPR